MEKPVFCLNDFSGKGVEMDVSDIRYLQIIYVIMEENEPERYSMSRYQFQSLIISGLSGCGFAIHSYDEGDNLFTIA